MREKEFLPLLKEKLGIDNLNELQRRMLDVASQKRDFILLAPTGSGKTVGFTLPMLKYLREPSGRVQAVIIAPSRELVQQISGVVSSVAAGFKVTTLYGGHKVEDEVNSLSAGTDIIVSTPGRLLDHINRRNVDVLPVRMVILDEFDKSLELGFESEMKKIVGRMKNASRYILTSATKADVLPDFLNLNDPLEINFLENSRELRRRMQIRKVEADSNDKLDTLLTLLKSITAGSTPQRTIVFVNHRESAQRVGQYLKKNKVDAVVYHGQLDQRERETALSMFNNGSRPILVSTDLAARGLDIEGVESVIHYHQPLTQEVYTHRNGRTARVADSGDIYLLIGPEEDIKPFVEFDSVYYPEQKDVDKLRSGYATLYVGDGKKEKLSKGDILGFLTKTCGLESGDVGKITVFDHYILVAVRSEKAKEVLTQSAQHGIKGRKRKVSVITD
ncbi:MAG: DEAD/DEAH box helicase [Muribaculum sp.]|nr:DEAD/DEAH box helicase [Muribaculum sp.]